MDSEIRKLLLDILEYIGADTKYADYAQLHSYVEWFISNRS